MAGSSKRRRKRIINNATVAAIVLLIVLVGTGFAMGNYLLTGTRLNASSKAYVDEGVPAIATTWNEDSLLEHSDPSLFKTASIDQITELFEYLRADLGPMKAYEGSVGSAKVTHQNGKTVITANYLSTAKFATKTATIQLTLIQHSTDQRWYITGFHVNIPKAPASK